jgi:glycosyltransferase involved in cell wall biosynthesis
MVKPRILISVPTKSHVEIAIDEIHGLQDMGYDCLPFPYTAKKGFESKLERLWVIIQNAFNLVKMARHFKPDIIHLNSRLEVIAGIRDFLTIMIFRSFYSKKVRFVIKSHGSDIEVLSSNQFLIGKIALPYLKKHVAAWLFLSTQERDEVSGQQYFNKDRIFVVKNIVRATQFKIDVDFKRRMNITPDSKVLLFAGRIMEEKGIFEVIRAFAMILVKHNAVLIINGDGAEFNNVKKLIDSLKLNNSVICTGFIPEQDVVQYYANSDILVFPTYFPEGFPMALFNAVAAGLSIVTTKTRAAIDFLSEPENCLWVKAKDCNSVYTAIDTLLQSDKLMADMRKNNKAKAVLFSQAQVCTELAQIMETVFIRTV